MSEKRFKHDLKVLFEYEPIVKIACFNASCKFNLMMGGWATCNLKHVRISSYGECSNAEVLKENEAEE